MMRKFTFWPGATPLRSRLPLRLILSKPLVRSVVFWTSQSKVEPGPRTRVVALSVPGELPGARKAPVPTLATPTVPAPPRREPVPRVTLPTVPLMERRPELAGTVRFTFGALTAEEILSVPVPSFWSVAPPVTSCRPAKVTLLLPRSSLAVAPTGTERREEMSSEFVPDQASLEPLAISITELVKVAPMPRAPDSKPRVAPPPTSTRTSPLKRLAEPPRTHLPVPSMARLARPRPAAMSSAEIWASKRFTPLLLATSLSSGVGSAGSRAMIDDELKVSGAAAASTASAAAPLTVKLREVVVAVVPVNSRVAPLPRTSLVGSFSAEAPNELLLSAR